MPNIFDIIVSVVFDGVSFAIILFIVSVGLSVTMGLMGFANLAHGAFAMIGGYFAASAMSQLGIPFLLAVLLAAVATGLVSVPFERFLYRPLYQASLLDQAKLTIGLVFISVAMATMIWGPLNIQLQIPDYLSGQVDLGFRKFPTYRAFLNVVGLAAIIGLWYGIERTTIGAMIRAAVDNRVMAQSVGIDVDRLFTLTFALGSALAAMGGALGIRILGLTPTFAIEYLVYFLVVVAVGGLGSIRGAFFAALTLGIVDNAGKYFFPKLGAFFFFMVTFIVLLKWPNGLFGRR
ncbi:MAG: branched-chain amino acid ABC transporter permease [Pseudorhodoplanes sp.]|jgi:branched-chain amino acid transport system permease protein|nr:branched-chain amino acid ABC transporter permease [Pseudorhodoplanes sp.]